MADPTYPPITGPLDGDGFVQLQVRLGGAPVRVGQRFTLKNLSADPDETRKDLWERMQKLLTEMEEAGLITRL